MLKNFKLLTNVKTEIIYNDPDIKTSVQEHSHKHKGSLETRAVLMIFLLECEISGVVVQSIHQSSEEWRLL